MQPSIPSSAFPPLIGDGTGQYRIQITGNSGTGKSSLGTSLAKLLDVPYISLDKLFWQPGWKETPKEEFRIKIRQAMNQNTRGWVVDGNYARKGGDIIESETTDVIWLDPPLILYLPRLILRTFLRLFRLRQPCSPGCTESAREVFLSKNSIVWWCLSQHWVNRKRGHAMMREIGLGAGSGVGKSKMRRIGGWGGDLQRWWRDVEDMIGVRGELRPV